jgi:hypothetical protein
MAKRIRGLRPRVWEREAKVGWKTVEESRNEVPHQKADRASPPRDEAII